MKLFVEGQCPHCQQGVLLANTKDGVRPFDEDFSAHECKPAEPSGAHLTPPAKPAAVTESSKAD